MYTMAQLSEESLMNTKASIRVVAPTKKGFAASFKVHSGFSMRKGLSKALETFFVSMILKFVVALIKKMLSLSVLL